MITTTKPNPAFALRASLAKVLDLPAMQAGVTGIGDGVIGRWYQVSIELDASSVRAA